MTQTLDDAKARALVESLSGPALAGDAAKVVAACRSQPGGRVWMLLHADAGVTWGFVEGTQIKLSTGRVPTWPTPKPTAAELQQLRIFGDAGELLIWRIEGLPRQLTGRVLCDVACADTVPAFMRPRDVSHVLMGSTLAGPGASGDGFTAVADRSGRVQVIPWSLTEGDFVIDGYPGEYPLELGIREYFESDPDNGMVRVAASRLVALRMRPSGTSPKES